MCERTTRLNARGPRLTVVEIVRATSFAALSSSVGALTARLADDVGLYLAAAALFLGLFAWSRRPSPVVRHHPSPNDSVTPASR